MSRNTKLVLVSALFLLLLFMPLEWIPISGITVSGQRVLAIFILATLLWVSELVPAYATSLTILGLLCITASNSAPFLMKDALEPEFMLSYSQILSSLAAPVVILFMGGFFIAIAATKYKLDINMARVLLQPIGTDYSKVMLGLMGLQRFSPCS